MQAAVANARMYSATPQVRADWKTLLRWVLEHAGAEWDVIDYDSPRPLSALWSRGDLGLALMCGLPFSQRVPRPTLVAAPVPSPARYGARPVYFTDIVVRADSSFQRLEDTFGGTIGFTLADSLSGGVALGRHLDRFRSPEGGRLYRRSVGNLINARGVIDALVRGDIDAGPLDSYYHDLLVRNEPVFAAQVRTVATTDPLPIPPLIATAPLEPHQVESLRAALAASAASPELAPVMERLLLRGFAFPQAADYDHLAALAHMPADELGEP